MDRDTHSLFKLHNAPLHLEQASIGRIGVIIQHINLAIQLLISFVLVTVLSLDLLTKFVLLVESTILVLDNVHLKDCSRGLLLCFDNLNLASVVLDFTDDVNKDVLKCFQLPTESHRFLALKTKDGLGHCVAKGHV